MMTPTCSTWPRKRGAASRRPRFLWRSRARRPTGRRSLSAAAARRASPTRRGASLALDDAAAAASRRLAACVCATARPGELVVAGGVPADEGEVGGVAVLRIGDAVSCVAEAPLDLARAFTPVHAAAAFSGDDGVVFGGGVPCLSFAPVFGDSARRRRPDLMFSVVCFLSVGSPRRRRGAFLVSLTLPGQPRRRRPLAARLSSAGGAIGGTPHTRSC